MRQRSETLRASCTPDSRPMRAFRLLGRFQFLHPLLYPLILTLLSAPLTTPLRADTISGTVKDPSGAVVAGAHIEISGSALAEPLVLTSDDTGKFVAANLSAGKYSVRVAKEGFDELLTTVDLHGTADLPPSLTITPQQTSATVNEKSSAFANSDPVYRQLRNNGLGDTFRCENFTLPIDVGTFALKSGTITFLATIDNVDADVLAAIYNSKHPSFFNAYMHGTPHKDLRFFLRTRVGAIPQMDSPEEVALVNCDGGGMNDGIWYSQHLKSELVAHTASSQQDRRLFATRCYNIETVIGKNNHLFSRATIMFEPLVPGERVLKFGLLPTLRVTRVTDEGGKDLHFIQENRKEDGSFYTVLDEAPAMGQAHSITVEYGGDKVLYDAGSGSYYIGARESWYPNLNGFGEKALYDLTFKAPPSK